MKIHRASPGNSSRNCMKYKGFDLPKYQPNYLWCSKGWQHEPISDFFDWTSFLCQRWKTVQSPSTWNISPAALDSCIWIPFRSSRWTRVRLVSPRSAWSTQGIETIGSCRVISEVYRTFIIMIVIKIYYYFVGGSRGVVRYVAGNWE